MDVLTFNVDLAHYIIFQDLYSVLVKSEAEGLLGDVNMLEVEKLILNPKAKNHWAQVLTMMLTPIRKETRNEFFPK